MSEAGTAYLVHPDGGPGPGVLVLHSWWGLTTTVKDFCNALADAGFTALAPDLLGGANPDTGAEAQFVLEEADMNTTAGLVISSAHELRARSRNPEAPVGAIGFSMGASWAYWLSARLPGSIKAVVAYYGTQNIEFDDAQASYLVHIADDDTIASADDTNETLAFLGLAGRPFTAHHYERASHFFAERGASDYDEASAELAWDRTLEFLRTELNPSDHASGN